MTQPDWSNKVFLVVEDEDHNYAYIHEILKRTNVTIIRAENGIQAIDIVDNKEIDVVLMDIKLPEMDGFRATKAIKGKKPSLPVIAQTAYAMEKEKTACFQAGCNDYISKPYEPRKLIDMIKRYVKE